jgi:outer membrane receptor protein involved in Fe transport
LKGDFFSRALTLDVAAFYIDWSDIQLRQVDQSTGESYIANGGEAKSQGVELSFTWSILDGLTLNGNGAYTDAVLTENAPLGTYGLSGDRLPYSAEWTGTLFLTQEFPVTNALDGFVSGGVTYLGDRLAPFNNAATTPRFVMPSYTTLDLRAGVSSGAWDVTLYIKNLTDEKGYLSATPRNSTTGLSAYGVGVMQPRAIGMSLAMKF